MRTTCKHRFMRKCRKAVHAKIQFMRPEWPLTAPAPCTVPALPVELFRSAAATPFTSAPYPLSTSTAGAISHLQTVQVTRQLLWTLSGVETGGM